MYLVSQEYKNQMRMPIRECQALAKIYIGVFDYTAASDATFSFPPGTIYSDAENVNSDIDINTSYATFEENYFRLDGVQRLLPESSSAFNAQGWISSSMSGEDGTFSEPPQIEIEFSIPHTMVGLTLTFGTIEEDVPDQITVISYLNGEVVNSQTVSEGMSPVYPGEFLLDNIDKIVIQYDKTKFPYGRARLNHIGFGIGYSFQNKDIYKIQEDHVDSPVSTALPTSKLSFTLKNKNHRFDVDSETALVRFLSEGQRVQVDYGVRLGNYEEWIPGGKWVLESWKISGDEVNFTATDALTRLTKSTYEKGTYDWKFHTMYEYAENVFADAGLTTNEYYIDPALQKFYSAAPMTIVSHAAALQVIANRALARLFVARDGRIALERLNMNPVFSLLPPSSTSRYTYYSDINSVLNGTSKNYATFEPDYFRLDGSMYLLPEGTDIVTNSGMTSKGQAAADGSFADDEALIWLVKSDSPHNVYKITINFGGQIPKQIGIVALEDGTWGKWKYFYPTHNEESFEVNFQHITRYQITVLKARKEGQRGHFNKVSVTNISDLTFDSNQVFEGYKSEMTSKLKNVTSEWIYRSYYPGVTEIVATTKIETNSGWAKIEHDCCYQPTAIVKESDVTLEQQHYAFVSYVRLTSSTNKAVEVKIQSQKLYESPYPIISEGNETGEDLPVDSPLYDSESIKETLDWVRDYYMRRKKFTLETKGFPEAECGDFVIYNNKPMQIIETKFTFNGAFKETFTLRGD